MAVSVATVRNLSRTGEFDDPPVTDDMITAAVAEAGMHLNAEAWGDRYDTGLALLAAHFLVDGASGAGAAGATPSVKSATLGPMSMTFESKSAPKPDDDPYGFASTPYGRRFLALRRTLIRTPIALFDNVTPNRGGSGWWP